MMIDELTVKYDYDAVLTGERPSYANIFRQEPKDQKLQHGATYASENEKIALRIIKYAIEYYLGWTPEQARDNFCKKTVELMKLDAAMQNINFPEESWADGDCSYVISRIYPEQVTYDCVESIIREYERDLASDPKHHTLPRGFYDDMYGAYRAKIVLRHVLSYYALFANPVEEYLFFYSPAAEKFLKKYRLSDACKHAFNGNPVAYLNTALPEDISKACAPLYEEMMRRIERKRKIMEAQEAAKAAEDPSVNKEEVNEHK